MKSNEPPYCYTNNLQYIEGHNFILIALKMSAEVCTMIDTAINSTSNTLIPGKSKSILLLSQMRIYRPLGGEYFAQTGPLLLTSTDIIRIIRPL